MSATLSESDSKALLAGFGVPFLPEVLASDVDQAVDFVADCTGQVAMKLCGHSIAHKSERGLVRLGVDGEGHARQAFEELMAAARPEDRATGVLVAPMAVGLREFIAGVTVDQVFGPTVAFGLGGVLAEAIGDITIRLAPLRRHDAFDMMESLNSRVLLGEFRGEPAVDRERLADLLCSLSEAATNIDGLLSIDLNPVMIVDGLPCALDALVELDRGVDAP